MTRALVTGGTGFAGKFLVAHLAAEGVEVHATAHASHLDAPGASGVHKLDVSDAGAVATLVRDLAADEVYHLAGVTRPASGDVAGFYDVNLGGARNILDAMSTHTPDAKLLLVGSAYAYAPSTEPIAESWPLEPSNHYGASKAASEMLGRAYAAEGMHVVLARPFNHSGPGQSPDFVLPSIVQQVGRAKASGRDEVTLELGNLQSVRDISDVRDVVAGYVVAIRKGASGAAYNLGSGVGRSIRELVMLVSSSSGIRVEISQSRERMRADDLSMLVARATRLEELGWRRAIDLADTVVAMLAHVALCTEPRE